jgi:hypothetical protein
MDLLRTSFMRFLEDLDRTELACWVGSVDKGIFEGIGKAGRGI